MRLQFRKIRYKNFLATGNTFTEISLNDVKSTLIIGTNGAGKSTLLDALCFVLYGKAFRDIKKPQLINSINKKATMVELELTLGDCDYLIRRGIKPNILEIYKDGEKMNQNSDVKSDQEYIETNILKMNYKSFCQIVILGSSTFVPFMRLATPNRRAIVEDLFDIQVFSVMNDLVKKEITTTNGELVELKHEIDMVKQKIKSSTVLKRSLDEQKQHTLNVIKAKIESIGSDIEENIKKFKELKAEVDQLPDYTSEINKHSRMREEMSEYISKFGAMLKISMNDRDFYQHTDKCPTCSQKLDETFRKETLEVKLKEVANYERMISEAKEKYDEYTSVIDDLKAKNDEVSSKKNNLSNIKNSIQYLKNELNSKFKELDETKEREVEIKDEENVPELKKRLKVLENEYVSKNEDQELNKMLAVLLKDGGIKAKIIKQYIPIINKLIASYLGHLGLNVKFELDEEFNETITTTNKETYSYSSFSEGEKAKIDLALILTWRAVSKMRNSVSTNLLIMDEVFDSSMDNTSVENLKEILNTFDSNYIVISHRADTHEGHFERVLNVTKKKDFTVMKES